MPRVERAKRDAENKNRNTANATGQTTIASFFTKSTQESGEGTTEVAETIPEKDVAIPSDSLSSCDSPDSAEPKTSAVIVGPWIKARSEFNEAEKLRSKNKGRFFQSEWFEKCNWLWYHREKHAAFCEVCTQYKQAHDNSPFIFSDSAMGF